MPLTDLEHPPTAVPRRAQEQLQAIAAIADGRYDVAAQILEQLQRGWPAPAVPGVCRFCGCSEARGCAILVAGSAVLDLDPTVIRCGWADPGCTICTNVSCLERWRRESPAELDVDVHDVVADAAPRSRIVVP